MKRAIGEQAAIRFAQGFYDALGAGKDYRTAFEIGRNAIDLRGIPESLTPVLKMRTPGLTPRRQREARTYRAARYSGGGRIRVREGGSIAMKLPTAPAAQPKVIYPDRAGQPMADTTLQFEQRRESAHIPEGVAFRTKPQIAAELVRSVAVLGQVEL